MNRKTNLELLELYNNSESKELAKIELEKRIKKYVRARNGGIHLVLVFIPKTSQDDEIVIKRVGGFYRLNDSANNGIKIDRDEHGKILWMS